MGSLSRRRHHRCADGWHTVIRIYQTFETEQQATVFRDFMYVQYHPLCYGTHIEIKRDEKTGKWIAAGCRAEH